MATSKKERAEPRKILGSQVEGVGMFEDMDPDQPLPPELLKGLKQEAERLGLPADFVER